MIDWTKEYAAGTEASDIDEWLRAYTEEETLDVKPILCSKCGWDELRMVGDQEEGAVQVVCMRCEAKKLLLDSAEYWKEVSHRTIKCPDCKSKGCNVRVGFARRENGQVRWVYIGNRCVQCCLLGSAFDWKIDYEPTDELEQNI